MAPPPVSIYVTSLTSQPKVRQNIELLRRRVMPFSLHDSRSCRRRVLLNVSRRSLRALEIPYTEHDLVIDEEAKTRWQRAKPTGQVIGLPGYLVGGEWVGTMDDFDYANETGTLPQFLHQDSDLVGNTSIGEAELERLMREMSDADLDALAAEVGKTEGGSCAAPAGKTQGADPANSADPGEATRTVRVGSPGSGDQESAANAEDPSGSVAQAASTKSGSMSAPASATASTAASASTAAQQTVESITSTAASIASSLGLDTSALPLPIPRSSLPTPGAGGSAVADTPTTGRSPASLHSKPAQAAGDDPDVPLGKGQTDRSRRLSKEEIAAEMMRADTVEGLMASLDMAEGKKKVD